MEPEIRSAFLTRKIEVMKNGFFDSVSGNRSSSRLSGFIVIIAALLFAQEVIWFGRSEIMVAAASAGTIFLTIAGPVMVFMFQNKQTEIRHEEIKKGNPETNQEPENK